MKEQIKKFISYFFVGGMAAIVEWITFAIANVFLNYMIATVISFIIATTANYILGRILTFKDYKKTKKDVILVFIVSGVGLLLNMLFMHILIDVIHFPIEILAKVISTGLVFLWNYISRVLFIYKEKEGKV